MKWVWASVIVSCGSGCRVGAGSDTDTGIVGPPSCAIFLADVEPFVPPAGEERAFYRTEISVELNSLPSTCDGIEATLISIASDGARTVVASRDWVVEDAFRWFVEPLEPLAPNTLYEVEYGYCGERTVSRFRTGAAGDVVSLAQLPMPGIALDVARSEGLASADQIVFEQAGRVLLLSRAEALPLRWNVAWSRVASTAQDPCIPTVETFPTLMDENPYFVSSGVGLSVLGGPADFRSFEVEGALVASGLVEGVTVRFEGWWCGTGSAQCVPCSDTGEPDCFVSEGRQVPVLDAEPVVPRSVADIAADPGCLP